MLIVFTTSAKKPRARKSVAPKQSLKYKDVSRTMMTQYKNISKASCKSVITVLNSAFALYCLVPVDP
jgi:hypothetical protein